MPYDARVRCAPLWMLAWLAAGCGDGARDPRPNVLLLSLDSVRADFVGAYGATLPHAPGRSPTPALDRLAAEGVLFTDALSTTSWTLPAHATLLTGVPELVHGVEQDGQSLPPELPTLAETLGARGYRTYGVYSGPYLDPRYGFARGFERYEAGYGRAVASAVGEVARASARVAELEGGSPERLRVAVDARARAEQTLELASHRDSSSRDVTDLVLAEIARAADDGRPFFLFAHYFDPHYDYAPPEAFERAFDPDYAGQMVGRDFFSDPDVSVFDAASPTGRRRVVDERDLEHLEALYAGEIAWTDSQVGRVLDALEERGLAANTLVVVVGDHGDEFFEHGSIGHRQTLHEEVTRVPCLLRLPGRLAAGERRSGWTTLAGVNEEIVAAVEARPARRSAEHAPLGRLVRVEALAEQWGLLDGATVDDRLVVSVTETFRHGQLKLERKRYLPYGMQYLGAVVPPLGNRLESMGVSPAAPRTLPRGTEAPSADGDAKRSTEFDQLLANEHLRWIDLAQHPEEHEEDWSSFFDGAAPQEALLEFRAAYAELVRRRASPPAVAESAELLAVLRGLGYVGEEARVGLVPADALVLPPPGSKFLDARAPR